MARSVAATGASGQSEAERERRIVDGVTSAAQSKVQCTNHALVGWIGVVRRGIHFWLPRSNELQICCRLLPTVRRAAVAMRVGRRGNTTRAVER